MILSQKMRALTAVAFFACISLTLANQRESVCCKQVSVHKITEPIIGFMVHQAKPPCVKAVIFFTSEGAICSHWKENWVKQKVVELRKLQAIEKSRKTNAATGTAQPTDSTSLQL